MRQGILEKQLFYSYNTLLIISGHLSEIITKIDQDLGVVDNDVTFELFCVSFGYAPYQGDWVKLVLEKPRDGTCEFRGSCYSGRRILQGQ